MSFSIDANILLYASDKSSPWHTKAQRFLEQHAQQTEVMYVAYTTLLAYLRLATHARVFRHPLTPDEALGNLEQLTGLANVRVLTEEEGFLEVYRQVVQAAPSRGNQVPDAHLASILKQHGVGVICTNDNDFRRFPFLSVRNPLV